MSYAQQTEALQRVIDHAHIGGYTAKPPSGTYHIVYPGINLYSNLDLDLTGVTLLAEDV